MPKIEFSLVEYSKLNFGPRVKQKKHAARGRSALPAPDDQSRVIAVTKSTAFGMKSAGIAVGAAFKRKHWSEVMSKYEYCEKRIHSRDLVAIWTLLAAVLCISAVWSFL